MAGRPFTAAGEMKHLSVTLSIKPFISFWNNFHFRLIFPLSHSCAGSAKYLACHSDQNDQGKTTRCNNNSNLWYTCCRCFWFGYRPGLSFVPCFTEISPSSPQQDGYLPSKSASIIFWHESRRKNTQQKFKRHGMHWWALTHYISGSSSVFYDVYYSSDSPFSNKRLVCLCHATLNSCFCVLDVVLLKHLKGT